VIDSLRTLTKVLVGREVVFYERLLFDSLDLVLLSPVDSINSCANASFTSSSYSGS
jgi:hypothetical protein